MSSILIFIPYFGTLPEVFPFWYNSALNNPDVDFLFITDCDIKEAPNIKVRKSTLEKEKERFEKALGMEICLPNAYKLCDFKAAYGFIYADEREGYDFWGFGDIDLVYGMIRDYFTEDVLARYDMISGWGHLTLYRNCEFCNTFFMRHHEGFLTFEEAFSKPENCCFDEYFGGCSTAWDTFYPERVFHCESSIDDIRIQSRCSHFRCEFNQERNCMTFMYKDRNLYRIYYDSKYRRHVEPTLYAHFQKRHNWTIKTEDYSCYIIYPDVFRKPFRFLQRIKLTWLGRSRTAHLI